MINPLPTTSLLIYKPNYINGACKLRKISVPPWD